MSKLKRFDVWQKPKGDEVFERTAFGALVSVATIVIVLILVVTEFSAYMKTEIASHLAMDTTVGTSNTRIDFDIYFYKVACARIDFTQEITRGQHHGPPNEEGVVTKINEGDGCHLFGSIVTDKIGGHFKFAVQPTEAERAAAQEEVARRPRDPFMPPVNARMFMPPPDLSHSINHVFFHDLSDQKGVVKQMPSDSTNRHPLVGARTMYTPDANIGVHHYALQVVPTSFHPQRGASSVVNQYSVTERQVEYANALPAINIGGAFYNDFIGVIFNYDFYPVKLVMKEENKGNIFEFLAGLCGVVGGVVTVLGLFEGFVHHSAKAVIGKKD